MALYRMQVALQDLSLLARDQYVNTFHLYRPDAPEGEPPITPDFSTLLTPTTDFYQGLHNYLAPSIDPTGNSIKVYDLAKPKETPPVYQTPMFLNQGGQTPGAGQTPLPNEVACTLTYHGFPQAGTVQRQSWRGRIYVGPLNTTASETITSTKHARPSGTFRGVLCSLGNALHAALVTAGWEWVIASSKQQTLYPIVQFSSDDSFDTIRSRGDRPTDFTVAAVTTHIDGVFFDTGIGAAVRP